MKLVERDGGLTARCRLIDIELVAVMLMRRKVWRLAVIWTSSPRVRDRFLNQNVLRVYQRGLKFTLVLTKNPAFQPSVSFHGSCFRPCLVLRINKSRLAYMCARSSCSITWALVQIVATGQLLRCTHQSLARRWACFRLLWDCLLVSKFLLAPSSQNLSRFQYSNNLRGKETWHWYLEKHFSHPTLI